MTEERELKSIVGAGCSACGNDHSALAAEKVEHDLYLNGDRVTHVAICPVEFKVIFFLDVEDVSGHMSHCIAQP